MTSNTQAAYFRTDFSNPMQNLRLLQPTTSLKILPHFFQRPINQSLTTLLPTRATAVPAPLSQPFALVYRQAFCGFYPSGFTPYLIPLPQSAPRYILPIPNIYVQNPSTKPVTQAPTQTVAANNASGPSSQVKDNPQDSSPIVADHSDAALSQVNDSAQDTSIVAAADDNASSSPIKDHAGDSTSALHLTADDTLIAVLPQVLINDNSGTSTPTSNDTPRAQPKIFIVVTPAESRVVTPVQTINSPGHLAVPPVNLHENIVNNNNS